MILFLIVVLVGCDTVVSFSTQSLSPLSIGKVLYPSTRSSTRLVSCHATKKKEKKQEVEVVNGIPKVEDEIGMTHASHSAVESEENPPRASDIADILNDINRQISQGSTELMENITNVMDQKLLKLPESSASELSEYISKLASEIQVAQQRELERQLAALEAQFVRPLEQLAFSDAPLFQDRIETSKDDGEDMDDEAQRRKLLQQELILAGKNSTIAKTSRMKTRDIIRNFDVAPLYYTIALVIRWAKKASYPSIVLLQAYKNVASIVKSSGAPRKKRKKKNAEQSYEEFIKDAEAMQSGWKRTGAIAAKGSLAKKWAILRRSAEVWSYFSSFYLKDRRILRKYESGRWSEERFKEERSKLGAEITQNLLRLGPTFIKVSNFVSSVLPHSLLIQRF